MAACGKDKVPEMLKILEIPVTPFQQNCTLLLCEKTGAIAVCDCGDAQPVLAKLQTLPGRLEMVLATHGHLDHIGGTAELLVQTQVPFYFPRGDDFLRESLPQQAQMYGFPPVEVPSVDVDLTGCSSIQVGACQLEILPCPGHTPGHVVFYDPVGKQLIAGDVLFQGSIGRTDFPRGSFEDLEASIQTQLYTLPADTVVHCGHGPTTTIGHEAATNPFVRARG